MKHQVLLTTFLLTGMIFLFLGCGNKENAKKVETPKETNTVDKHPETQKLQAADAVGYDGTAIKKNVDKMLDKTDENNKKAEEIIEK